MVTNSAHAEELSHPYTLQCPGLKASDFQKGFPEVPPPPKYQVWDFSPSSHSDNEGTVSIGVHLNNSPRLQWWHINGTEIGYFSLGLHHGLVAKSNASSTVRLVSVEHVGARMDGSYPECQYKFTFDGLAAGENDKFKEVGLTYFGVTPFSLKGCTARSGKEEFYCTLDEDKK